MYLCCGSALLPMSNVEVEHLWKEGVSIEIGVKFEAPYELGHGVAGEIGAFDAHIQKKIESWRGAGGGSRKRRRKSEKIG